MRRRTACVLSVFLALGLGGAWGDEPDSAPARDRAPAAEKAAPEAAAGPLGIGFSVPPLPAVAPGEQAFLYQPQPLLPGPLPVPVPIGWPEPPMSGPFIPVFAPLAATQRVNVNLPTLQSGGVGIFVPAKLAAVVRTPVLSGSAFAIAADETPRPLDRAFVTYSYTRLPTLPADPLGGTLGLSSFGAPINGSSFGVGNRSAVALLQQLATSFPTQYSHYVQAAITQQNFVLPGANVKAGTTLVGSKDFSKNKLTAAGKALVAANSSDAQFQALVGGALTALGVANAPINALQIANRPFNRSGLGGLLTNPANLSTEVAGFEKTFLDGNASIGLRVPAFQIAADAAQGIQGFGDLTAIIKYALYNDLETGNLLSLGLAVTARTGPSVQLASGGSNFNPNFFQPFVGGIYRLDRFYAQSFCALVVPDDARTPALLFNDLAIGYALYYDPISDWLTSIIPSVEAHTVDPLTHRGLNAAPVGAVDMLSVAGALNLTFRRLCFTTGVSTPLTGPLPFNFGAFAQVNFIF